MILSGIFAGVISVGLIGVFYHVAMHNPLMMELCLKIIAGGFAGFLISMVVVIISMAVGGPVGRFKLHAGQDGVDLESDGDGVPPAPVVVQNNVTSVPEGTE